MLLLDQSDPCVILGYGYQIEVDGDVYTKVTLPIDMPALLASIFEREPFPCEACKLQVVENLAITRVIFVKHPLVRGAFVAFGTILGWRLGRWEMNDLQMCFQQC